MLTLEIIVYILWLFVVTIADSCLLTKYFIQPWWNIIVP